MTEEEYLPRGSGQKGSRSRSPGHAVSAGGGSARDTLFGRTTAGRGARRKGPSGAGGRDPKRARQENRPRSTSRTPKSTHDVPDGLEDVPSASQGPAKVAATLTFKSLAVGMSVLGVVSDVSATSAKVSLPCQLTGVLPATLVSPLFAEVQAAKKRRRAASANAGDSPEDASLSHSDSSSSGSESESDGDEARQGAGGSLGDNSSPEAPAALDLRHLLTDGDIVPCVVARIGSEKRGSTRNAKSVILSVLPSAVHAGHTLDHCSVGKLVWVCVRSVEDHGYVIDTGISGTSGFLSRSDAEGHDLCEGKPLFAAISSVNKSRGVLKLTLRDDALRDAKKALADGDAWTLESLRAGVLVEAVVAKRIPGGFSASLLGVFRASILDAHNGDEAAGEQAAVAEPGKKVRARVLFVDPRSKTISLTARPTLVELSRAPQPPKISYGVRLNGCEVVRAVDNVGLWLRLPDGSRGFAHVSRLSDEHVENVPKMFPVGTKVRCRILGFDRADGVAMVGLRPAIMDAHILRAADARPGELAEGIVREVTASGLRVVLGESVVARVTPLHMGDAVVRNVSKRFRVGQKVSGRVLETQHGVVYLTLKPSLVGSELDRIAVFSDAVPGRVSHGFVSSVRTAGVHVTFYGGVNGLVRAAELGLGAGEDPADRFRPGQVLRCRVVSADAKRERLHLSLRASTAVPPALQTSSAAEIAAASLLRVGSVLEASLDSAAGDDVWLVRLSVPAPEGGASGSAVMLPARIETAHLADEPEQAAEVAALLAKAPAGASLGHAVVLQVRDAGAGRPPAVVATLKPALVRASLRFVGSSVSSAEGAAAPLPDVGSAMCCYVRNVQTYGVFVGLPGPYGTALAPVRQVEDSAAPALSAVRIGATVNAVVTAVDTKTRRVTVSLRESDVAHRAELAGVARSRYTTAALCARLQRLLPGADGAASAPGAPVWAKLEPGAVVKAARAGDDREYGSVFDLGDGVVGVAANESHGGAAGAGSLDDSQGRCVILDVDAGAGTADVSARSTLVRRRRKALRRARRADRGAEGNDGSEGHSESELPRSALSAGESTKAVVELVRDTHAVVSLPDHGYAVAILCLQAFSLRGPQTRAVQVAPGDKLADVRISAVAEHGRTFVALPPPSPTLSKDGRSASSDADAKEGRVSTSTLKPGDAVDARVEGAEGLFLHVRIGRARARIHVSEVADPSAAVGTQKVGARAASEAAEHPFAKFRPGQTVAAHVLARARVEQASSAAGAKSPTGVHLLSKKRRIPMELTLRGASRPAPVTMSKLAQGQRVVGFVDSVTPTHAWIQVSSCVRGRLDRLDASDDLAELREFTSVFTEGTAVACDIEAVDASAGRLTLRRAGVTRPQRADVAGKCLVGRVLAQRPGERAVVCFGRTASRKGKPSGARGTGDVVHVHLCDAAPCFVASPLAAAAVGSFVRCRVIEPAKGENATPRAAFVETENGKVGTDVPDGACAPVASADEVSPGEIRAAYVKSVTPKGCFVWLGQRVQARIRLADLSDGFVRDLEAAFAPGTMVRGRILDVDRSNGQINMSLRESSLQSQTPSLTLDDFEEGAVVRGKVRTVASYGVFVALQHSDVVGLAHISEVSNERIASLESWFNVGDHVRVKIIKIDREKGRVSLGMKSEYFEGLGDPADESSDGSASDEDEDAASVSGEDNSSGGESEASEEHGSELDSASDDGDDDDEDEDEDEEMEDAMSHASADGDKVHEDDGMAPGARSDDGQSSDGEEVEDDDISVGMKPVGFDFQSGERGAKSGSDDESEGPESASGDSDSDGDDGEWAQTKRAARRKRKLDRAREEDALREREDELRDADGGAPGTADDFEKLLLASPDSSYVWVRYMAYWVHVADVDKARAIGERALESIAPREEEEKFNVWVALMNLENRYGTHEALMDLVKRASVYNEPKRIYLKLIEVFASSGKDKSTEEAHRLTAKKFGQSKKVWIGFGEFLFQKKRPAEARAVLDRALKALPKRKHIATIAKFAQFEFKYGSAERGRTIFDSILSNYPKRVDLWSVYLDMELKVGDAEVTRRLLERMTSLNLSTKKMKFLFKRFLEFESKFGNEETVERVKEKAREYLSSRTQ